LQFILNHLMKRYLFLIMAGMAFASCKTGSDKKASDGKLATGEVTINGQISGLDTGLVEIFASVNDVQKADSVTVKDGKFTYKTQLPEPSQVAIRIAGDQGHELVFFADPGTVTIQGAKDSFEVATVKAGETQQLYKQVEDSIKNIMKAGESLYQEYVQAQSTQDMATMQRVQEDFVKVQNKARQFATRFGLSNGNSVLAPFLGIMYLSEEGNDAAMKQLYDTLSAGVKASFFGKKLGDAVTAAQSTSVGATAPDFTLPDVKGNSIALSSLRGKYVLVDFWASWCGPCRQENPNVVKAYNQFKDKGFTVLGVSLDQKKEDWEKAIAADKLTWTHVSDLKYWDNAAAKLYGIQAIPASYLLDKEGKIIGKNLRGAELEAKLKEVLK
jgi:peroxiredoxin